MPRPVKQTVDYFSHDSNASAGKTLTILYNHFGHEGISAWWQLLERLADTPSHFIDIRNSECFEYLAARLRFSPDKAKSIFSKMAELEAIDQELYAAGIIWSGHLIGRLEHVYKARNQSYPSKPVINNPISDTDNPVSLPDNTQIKVNEIKVNEIKDTLQGAKAPFDPFTCCNSFADYRNLLDGYENQVGFLVGAFKRIHHDAPARDFEDPGGRLGNLWAKNNRDTGFILKVMWDISSTSIAGSHMDFLYKALEARKSRGTKGNGAKADPDKFIKGKFAHMVQR